MTRDITNTLLPIPKEAARLPGACRIGPHCSVESVVADARFDRALRAWLADLAGESHASDAAIVRVAVDRSSVKHEQGYRVEIAPDEIRMIGGSVAACFHALQTLRQLTDSAASEVLCCTIVDWPDFETRGLLYDITRGRVPTLDTLKRLVDRLAALKINQLQLYVEHAFVFAFDPEICDASEGLTRDEVRALDDYCRARFIDLVPSVANLGHMGRILSLPKYRHLAEVEATKPWSAMSWPERMRGFTLDCMNPEAHRLVQWMWADILDAFSGPVVNLCGDEPWDLGAGKNKDRFSGNNKADAYLGHLRRVHDLCARRGRRTQFWSDVVRNYPDRLRDSPRDSTVLHWGYDDRSDYEGTAALVATGLETHVCPGTSGWKRVLNAMNLAERNIATFAEAGARHGATGLLNTDWGDHGHFNMPACSWHGIALGAALGWDARHPIGADFDRRFVRRVWGLSDETIVSRLRAASAIAERCETWRLLWMPARAVGDDSSVPSADEVASARFLAGEARRAIEACQAVTAEVPHDLSELHLACRFSELFADKIAMIHASGRAALDDRPATTQSREWTERLKAAAHDYAERWFDSYKPSGLSDILGALSAAGSDLNAR